MAKRQFQQWVPWGGRLQVDGRRQAGVYLLGRFEGAPSTVVDPLGPEVIYIGETHAQTLEKRWDQFHYCAFMGGTGHSGGVTFYARFSNSQVCDAPGWLFVAALPLMPEEAQRAGAIKRELLRDYAARNSTPPACNTRAE